MTSEQWGLGAGYDAGEIRVFARSQGVLVALFLFLSALLPPHLLGLLFVGAGEFLLPLGRA
jgi:hypothetical protein